MRQLYPTNEAPRYVKGHAVTLALVAMAGILYGLLSLYLQRLNAQRNAGKEDSKIVGMTEAQIAELADGSPRFRFTI